MPNATITKPAETQRRRRGHNFFPPKSVLKKIPALYATDGTKADEKIVHWHIFGGPFDAYITELDPETMRAYGFVRIAGLGSGEWGYIDLTELEALTAHGLFQGARVPGMLILERDCWWDAVPFGQIKG